VTRRSRTAVCLALLSATALVAGASPAGAQQLIDATEEGGEAFIAFTVMVVIFTFTLFMMDRVRRRRPDEE
jgi:hypothetical protein